MKPRGKCPGPRGGRHQLKKMMKVLGTGQQGKTDQVLPGSVVIPGGKVWYCPKCKQMWPRRG